MICLDPATVPPRLWQDPDAARLLWYLVAEATGATVTVTASEVHTRFGITRQRLRTLLRALLDAGILSAVQPAPNQQATNITFVNQPLSPQTQPAPNQLPTSSTPRKAPAPRKKFTPPTREEAQQYIDRMGFHWGDADLFISWNQSKGWKVGDQPMKDWKAAMRTWEHRWKQKYNADTTDDKYRTRRGTDPGDEPVDYTGSF